MDDVRKDKKIADRVKKQRVYRLRYPKIPGKVRTFLISVNVNSLLLLQIYVSGVFKNKKNPLVNLPAEVKHMIFKALPTMADRACLGITCKDQAAVYEQLNSETNKKDYNKTVAKKATDLHRLQMLVRLKPDMAPTYRLCYTCNQFIDLNNRDNAGMWGGSELRVRGLKADRVATVEGPRCPLCVAAKQIEAVSYKDTYKKFLALSDPRRW